MFNDYFVNVPLIYADYYFFGSVVDEGEKEISLAAFLIDRQRGPFYNLQRVSNYFQVKS